MVGSTSDVVGGLNENSGVVGVTDANDPIEKEVNTICSIDILELPGYLMIEIKAVLWMMEAVFQVLVA